jgi:hypothetical protein
VLEISLPYVDCFVCLLLVPSADNSCVVYYFLQFLVKKKREQRLGPEFVSFSFFKVFLLQSVFCEVTVSGLHLCIRVSGFWRLGF